MYITAQIISKPIPNNCMPVKGTTKKDRKGVVLLGASKKII